MTIRHIKHETGHYTYDTETGKWTKLSANDSLHSEEDTDMNMVYKNGSLNYVLHFAVVL